ncbi:hypothetical protein [Peterkaempfera bronchialis]|uniref:Uncharacterized protein n=1 Tax=Peterkaempfera bronchialis TaxID=2126346 RepID=A0A345T462_9ACTN|nr:hypothetical protein [Peterkaempfera bronchialis]AXI80767.1 hypothetical protein C7M71_028685 [Peterkaempfera bronchialis]
MPVLDQRTRSTEAALRAEDVEPGNDPMSAAEADPTHPGSFRGIDPGDGDTWEILRLRCPECDRPIALLGDEERFPQHAVLHSAWNPFASAVCPGSGRPVDEAADLDDDPDFDAEPDLEALLALPPELDWRTQPFSHVGGPGSRPVRVPQQQRLAQR